MNDATQPSTRCGAWIPGVVLIGLGVVFPIQNYLGREIRNCWALRAGWADSYSSR